VEVVSPGLARTLGPPLSGLTTGSEDFSGCLLLAGFAGHQAAVARSVSDVEALYRGVSQEAHVQTVWWDDEAETVYDALSGARSAAVEAGLSVAARASMPLSEVWALAQALVAAKPPGSAGPVYRVGAARGTLDLFAAPGGDAQPLSDRLTLLRRLAGAAGGHLVVIRGLHELVSGFDPWGETGTSLPLMKSVKQRFDPRSTLNRGRFVGGI
jgi:FAD/FMN-containing dehydrogenase